MAMWAMKTARTRDRRQKLGGKRGAKGNTSFQSRPPRCERARRSDGTFQGGWERIPDEEIHLSQAVMIDTCSLTNRTMTHGSRPSPRSAFGITGAEKVGG